MGGGLSGRLVPHGTWRKVRAPKSSVAGNARQPRGQDQSSRDYDSSAFALQNMIDLSATSDRPQQKGLARRSCQVYFKLYSEGGKRVKRGNLYAEQDQIGPEPEIARFFR